MKKKDAVIPTIAYPGRVPSQEQHDAIIGSLTKGISLTHGGPGTGKTTISAEITRIVKQMGKKILIIALTGAATSRQRVSAKENKVSEYCTIMTMAMAITRQSKIKEMKFDYVLIDEVSMINSGILATFISCFKTMDYRLILVGDINQLPPIDYGNFMEQIIKTPIHKFELKQNYRSQKTIIKICEQVIDKDRIKSRDNVDWNLSGSDFNFHVGGMSYLDNLIEHYSKLIDSNDKERYSRLRDKFTIIGPYKKDKDEINRIFQKHFFKDVKEYTEINYSRYHIGDRVMKLRNDYDIDVMNGEQGKVIKIAKSYIVCKFRNDPSTITPYVEKSTFYKMKDFIVKNQFKYLPFTVEPDGTQIDKPDEQIKSEILMLKKSFTKFFDFETNENGELVEINSCRNEINSGESIEYKKEDEYRNCVRTYFELLESYPKTMYNIADEAEFIIINDNLTLCYYINTYKAQGDQYDFVIFFLSGQPNPFCNIPNIYTGFSRAKEHLDIVTQTEELLNLSCLNRLRHCYDKLYHRINLKMPKEIMENFKEEEEEIEEFSGGCDIDDCSDYEYDY